MYPISKIRQSHTKLVHKKNPATEINKGLFLFQFNWTITVILQTTVHINALTPKCKASDQVLRR